MNFQTLLSKKSSRSIIFIIIIVVLADGYYLYDNIRINNLNKLIDELNMIDEQFTAISNDHEYMIGDSITILASFTTKEEMQKAITNMRASLNKTREKIKNLKNGLKTDKAIEYVDNFIARKNLYIDIFLLYMDNMESYVNDNALSTLTYEEYIILEEKHIKDSKEIEQKLTVLENKKNDMEKELSKLLNQPISLN